MTPEQHSLVLDNLAFLYFYLKKIRFLWREWIPQEDAVATGKLAMCKAALTFVPSLGNKFITFAARAIYREIETEVRRWYDHRIRILDQVVNLPKFQRLTLLISMDSFQMRVLIRLTICCCLRMFRDNSPSCFLSNADVWNTGTCAQ